MGIAGTTGHPQVGKAWIVVIGRGGEPESAESTNDGDPKVPVPAAIRFVGGAYSSDLTMFSHIALASPNSIIVLSRKNSSLSTPA